MRTTLPVAGLALALATWLSPSALASQNGAASDDSPGGICSEAGHWISGHEGQSLQPSTLFSDLADRRVILLGEIHDNAEHHRWQLHTLASLLSRSDELVIGFEMFPRRVQPALDRWTRGELTEKEFLEEADWQGSWGFDPGLYMPLFDFARMYRIPMVALNVDRELISRVGSEGWDAVPEEEREGVGNPAKALADYEQTLAEIYSRKLSMMAQGEFEGMASMEKEDQAADEPTIDEILERPEFKRFVSAQLTWDRAMAEGLAEAKQAHADATVVGVMGGGHLSYFHGVPHQLDDLGISDRTVLMPVEAEQACDLVGTNFADAMFIVQAASSPDAPPRRMRLGVTLSSDDESALVDRIMPDSVAEATQLQEGDRIIRAAGIDIPNAKALVEVIARQAPGTWLPMTVERSGSTVDLVAKFPPAPDDGS